MSITEFMAHEVIMHLLRVQDAHLFNMKCPLCSCNIHANIALLTKLVHLQNDLCHRCHRLITVYFIHLM